MFETLYAIDRIVFGEQLHHGHFKFAVSVAAKEIGHEQQSGHRHQCFAHVEKS